jgi:magnesium-transporting ATPase (P-type)
MGVIAYKDNIMPGAQPLIKGLSDSGVNISILTGDKFFNSFIAARTLNIIDFDFRDTSKYYSLRFENIFSAANEIYRILETLYERLREKNVANLENINEHSEMSKKLIEEAKGGIKSKSKSSKRRLRRLRTSILDSPESNAIKTALEQDSTLSGSIFKTMVINGKSIELILSDKDLISHFKFLLYFSKNIIGYSLKPYHKGKIVEFLKHKNKSSTIMAVGDGFNDMAMLKKADIGI